MKIDVLYAEVAGLKTAAVDLLAPYASISSETLEAMGVEGKTRLAGHAFGAAILASFATELALKAISAKMTGTCQRKHDLVDLFDALPREAQRVIAAFEKALEFRVKPVLEAHRDSFERWRYVAEAKDDLNVSYQDLDRVLNVLLQVFRLVPPAD